MFQQFHLHLPSKENKIYNFRKLNKIKNFNIVCFKILILCFTFISTNAFGYYENYYYEVQFGNLIVGKAEISIEKNSNEIKLKTKSQTAGFLNAFYEYNGELYSSSIKKKKIWTPKIFSTKGIFNNKLRISIINWKDNNLVEYKNDPILDLTKVHNIDQSTLKEVIDPVTAFINIVEEINLTERCDKSFRIFDGRRRYDLQVKSLGNTFLINDRPKSFNGNTLICGLKIIPLGGHRLETKWKPKEDKFSDFKIFFGTISSGRLLPVRMNLERWFGTVTVRLIGNNL